MYYAFTLIHYTRIEEHANFIATILSECLANHAKSRAPILSVRARNLN